MYRGAVDWADKLTFPVIVKPPQEDASIGISSVRTGKRGNAASPASSTFLQLTDRLRSAGIAAIAANPRLRRL